MSLLRILTVLLALAGIGGAGAYLFGAHAKQQDENARIADQLRALRHYEAVLNQDVLKVRSGLTRNYDSVVTTVDQMNGLMTNLRRGYFGNKAGGDAQLAAQLNAYQENFAQRRVLIERFKGRNAILRNSLFYFPTVAGIVKTEAQKKGDKGNLGATVDSLLQDLLVFYVHGYPKLQKRIRGHLHKLSAMSDEVSPALARQMTLMIKHASLTLSHKQEVDSLVAQITSAGGSAQLEALFQNYQARYL